MKKSIISLLAIFGLLVFTSCEDTAGPVMEGAPEAPEITEPTSGSSFVLNEEDMDVEMDMMEWSAADFGFSAAVEYTIQMDMEGNSFEEPVEIAKVRGNKYSPTVGDLNTKLLAAGLPFGTESLVHFRIKAEVSSNVRAVYSQPVQVGITPYEFEVTYPEIYVPGGYQSASGYGNDWTPEDAPALYSINSNDRYEGYVYYANDNQEFKFTADRSWDLNWGDDGADGTLQENGANIVMENAGYYKVNVDLNNFTYTLLSTDWGIIGDATPGGWDADTDMTYDVDDKVWRITINLNEGEMKFRANDAWDLNYGSDDANGTLQPGGGNIPVETAGNYTIELDLTGPIYRYSLELN
ncbi:SusE domain-containing protein [Rhodohalobacter halophilus]|uniref:SusE domain-containing protein n=1 Tax=Rhodohalobacter halophilus TaxID=1812810 RepID=UPI00083FC0C5|nr:SusE domain-containing protein [Rhodohalobacter halophilus]